MIDTSGLSLFHEFDPATAALEYAARGLAVVPLHSVKADVCSCQRGPDCGKSAGKHPRIGEWQKLATSDVRIVGDWFAHWAASNVGLAMGGPLRLIALDIDGADGRASLGELEALHGALPRTLTSRSGRVDGGEHRLFVVPAELDLALLGNRVGNGKAFAKGLDVRSTGGQIVVAPSVHKSGNPYMWIDEAPVADLPRWLYDLAASRPEPAAPAPCIPALPRPQAVVDRVERARKYLATIDGAVEGQHGGTATFVTAQKIGRGFDLDESTTYDLLAREYNPRCSPPWTEHDLRRKVSQAFREGTFVVGSLLDVPMPDRSPRYHSSISIEKQEPPSSREPGDDSDEHEGAPPPPPKPVRLSPSEFIISTIGQPTTRLATGFATLDRATRGGLMTGKLGIIGGAPNAGKTTLLVQLAIFFARADIHVMFLAKDEDREGILFRVGQQFGLSLEDLENDVPGARARLAEVLAELPTLHVRDQDEEGVLLEEAERELFEAADGKPAALLVDSVQTVRCAMVDPLQEKRGRVEAAVAALKRIAKTRHWLVAATCELSRGAYRSKDPNERIDDLAAFKESGDIEYAASVAIVLRSVAGEQDLVDVAMPKVKRGVPEPMRMHLDRARARFREVPIEDRTVEETTASEAFLADLERARKALLKHPGVNGNEAWLAYLKDTRLGTTRGRAAIRFLWGAGEVQNRGDRMKPRLFWCDPTYSNDNAGGVL